MAQQWLNPPLRFAQEAGAHKAAWDLLGDLALVSLPRAQVFAFRGSHWAAHRFWRGPWLHIRPA